MKRVKVGGLDFAWREWGSGDVTVLFIHGNLASKDWIELATPHFTPGIRTIAVDWRGCGDSDKPAPLPDFSNYSIARHADDMLGVLDALNISFCHLATHSTGGIISSRMLLKQPERFGRVLALDPVAPQSFIFPPDKAAFFGQMKMSKTLTRQVMAMTAVSLFDPQALATGTVRLRENAGPRAALFEKIAEQAFSVSDGIWFGTPYALTMEARTGWLKAHMEQLHHPHLVLWGMLDNIIQLDDLRYMASHMPDCRLVTVPGVGHSMNVEAPELFAGHYNGWFGGLPH
ncbi:MAG: alpha/beta fold hydrolase [Xanthobacter sp.]